MAWFGGNLSLGNFPDLAGAVNKLSESVKNIEKNFDNALGLEDKSESSSEAPGMWPVIGFQENKSGEGTINLSEKSTPDSQPSAVTEKEAVGLDELPDSASVKAEVAGEENEELKRKTEDEHSEDAGAMHTVADDSAKFESVPADTGKTQAGSQPLITETHDVTVENVETLDSADNDEEKPKEEVESSESLEPIENKSEDVEVPKHGDSAFMHDESHEAVDVQESIKDKRTHANEIMEESSSVPAEALSDTPAEDETDHSAAHHDGTKDTENAADISNNPLTNALPSNVVSEIVSESTSSENNDVAKKSKTNQLVDGNETDGKEQHLSSASTISDPADSLLELEKIKREMKMMETALQGAARQAQAKADEIARLMNENEQLKSAIEDLKRKPNEAEIESLREEYHQRVAALERKVYALTKERDTLRREQSRRNDATALLKEKDEIINQVMAEGEALSKKQAAQEAQIRKLRAQIRELEEEKKGLLTKLQVEENKVESIKKDKDATEKLLEETIEKSQAELGAQKEFYTNALNAAKEAEALAEARANDEARTALESRLKEAEEREAMLVQTLEELRQTLSRQEHQAAFREDMLRRDIEDLQKRYQASERRCEELVTQVPESTRPLLRQIEAMQETTARRAEAWAAVERSLNSRLQEAEAKAAAAEERERSINERLSQTLSRINVLEAQISCLRAEQTQLSRSLEKERQRAAENRQEYLAAKEEVDTLEGRAKQLEEEIRELRRKQKQELQDALIQRELLQQEIEKEKAARLELESTVHVQSSVSSQPSTVKNISGVENGNVMGRLSSASSLGSMEESYFLQASLDSSDSISGRRNIGETTVNPYYMKSMTPSAFEATLRQKEGELASYMSRLQSMEAIRDSLAEELVKMTEQCEKLRAEAALLPGIQAELEALRRRHSAALELMGERDEELEELRADIVDLKEMYREQVSLLVNQIQTMNSSSGAA